MADEIAFLGLGHMGAPMAANLLDAGRKLVVFDVVADALRDAEARGARVAASAADAARSADVVITMLPTGKHVHDVYLGSGGVLEAVREGALLIDSSTIDAVTARQVSEAARSQRGLDMLDAPVSGGVGGAVAGTLTFMVGGSDAALTRARPLLEIMGKNIYHAGAAGAGQIAKICNNMLAAILMIGTSEALNLAQRHGLDPTVVSNIMKTSSGGNWALNVYNPYPGVMEGAPASRNYEPGFMVDLMLKDLGLAMNAGVASGAATPLGAVARNLYAAHSAAGNGRLDFSSIIQVLGDSH